MVPIKEIATLVAHKAYEQKKDPNKVFLEEMKKYPTATVEHKKRVIEMANKKLFHLYYKDGIHEFPLVDPKIVLSMANNTDKTGLSKKSGEVAGLQKAASASAVAEPDTEIWYGDFEIDGTFATSEAAAVGGSGFLPEPRWWRKTASADYSEAEREYQRLQKRARVEELLSGKGMKIPAVDLIRPYVDPKIVENLEFKKMAGAQEDEAMARELLRLLAELSTIEEGGD